MQKSVLKCSDARHLVHLAVGDDTLPDEELQLSEHLHSCSDCRAYHAGMADAMHVIERVRDEDLVEASGPSLWPRIAGKLNVQPVKALYSQKRRFNGSVVALCACSLMLALVTLVQSLPLNDVDSFSGIPAVPAMNVNFNNQQPVVPGQAIKLVEVPGPNGTRLWVDPATNKVYVPSFAPASSRHDNGQRDLTFLFVPTTRVFRRTGRNSITLLNPQNSLQNSGRPGRF